MVCNDFLWIPIVSHGFPSEPDTTCRPAEARAGFLAILRMRAYARAAHLQRHLRFKNKISHKLALMQLPAVCDGFLLLLHGFHGFPMHSNGFPYVFL